MFDIINGYAISYRVGAEQVEVRKIGYIECGMLMDCVLVFRGTWDECKEYALNHINLFRGKRGLAPLNKREWVEMEMY